MESHGRLVKPASRASAFRYGFNTPSNWNDMATFCGGKHFDAVTPATCNICGGRPRSSEFLAPGRFATGTITGEYKMGQRIKIKYEATTNHLGYFLTKLCKNDNVKRDPAQSCFDATVLKTPEGKTTYPMKGPIGISKGYGGNGKQWHEWYVVLPQGITCEQCILQVSSFFPKHVRTKNLVFSYVPPCILQC